MNHRMKHVFFLAVLHCSAGTHAFARENLALGRKVAFAPAPNYRLTQEGDTDPNDLTDGRLTSRKDNKLWFDPKCVGFRHPGLVQLSVDLGATQAIGEVAIRLQGGSPRPGISFPGWVDVVASPDARIFYKVASYSKWRPGDRQKFGIPRNEGKAWVHKLVFPAIDVRARCVGLSFYGSALNVSDELYVMRGDERATRPPDEVGEPVAFTTSGARVYFHKPVLKFSTNIATPNPIGLILAEGLRGEPLEVILDLPRGVRFVGGRIGDTPLAEAEGTAQGRFTRYGFKFDASKSTKAWARVFLGGDWPEGRRGVIRYVIRWPGGETPLCAQPVEAIEIPRCPVRSRRLMLGLGWWGLGGTLGWPDALDAFETIGFNTVPLFARYADLDDPATQAFLETCRDRGFGIVNIDSPLNHMLKTHREDKSLYCQLADGAVEKRTGRRFCPSYRGPRYDEELRRLARETARVRASYVSCDIELWSWRGPTDAANCTRCQADFEASGHKDLKEWQLDKGFEMWRDLARAVRREMRLADLPMPDMGAYDFRPGSAYQHVWPFDRLYPEYMQSSQVSTYTPLEPYHIELIGDEVRADRSRLPRSDVLPWITPGDAGTFSGEAFRLALLECFAGGARGVYFWSGRVWDTDTLAGFARAIRNVAPVEDIIVDGEPLCCERAHQERAPDSARTTPPVRVSGLRKGDRLLVLVADYHNANGKEVSLDLPVDVPSDVVDLDTGTVLGTVGPDNRSVPVEIGLSAAARAGRLPGRRTGERARLLLVKPQAPGSPGD